MYYIARDVDASVEECGIMKETSLGSGVVSIPNEIAIAANIQKILIGGVDPKIYYLTYPRENRMLWVRYDTELQYDSASPGLVSEHTVAKRPARMRHMIQLPYLPQTCHEVSVLKFLSLEDPSLAIAIIIPGFHHCQSIHLGGEPGLLLSETILRRIPLIFKPSQPTFLTSTSKIAPIPR